MSIELIGLIGSVIGGIGQGMMERSRQQAEEEAEIAEEQRAEERYRGAGEAMAFWRNSEADPDASIAAPHIEPHKKSTTPLGKIDRAPHLGQQFKKKAPPPRGFNGMVPT